MHDPVETGKTIERLRKQAGYTQKTLADALCVTDKAVSKWERGIASPNISLLPKLSALLDADMGAILSGILTVYSFDWKGILVLDENIIPYDFILYDKPMVYYLISTFLLVGIKEVLIISSEKTKEEIYPILQNGSDFGISLSYVDSCNGISFVIPSNHDFFYNSNILACTKNFFYFGASLSRQLQGFMSSADEIIGIAQNSGSQLPMFFIPKEPGSKLFSKINQNINQFSDIIKNNVQIKKMSRGIISIPLDSYENLNEVASFINFYQRHHNQQIGDIYEIAKKRDLI